MKEAIEERLQGVPEIKELSLKGCKLNYVACDYICNMIEEKGAETMRSVDFERIFEDTETEEAANSINILAE